MTYSRTRSRSDIVTITSHWENTSYDSRIPSSTATSGSDTQTVSLSDEWMSDAVGSSKEFHGCDHQKVVKKMRDASITSIWDSQPGVGSRTVYTQHFSGLTPNMLLFSDISSGAGEGGDALLQTIISGGKGSISSIEALVDIAQTIKMLRNPLQLLSGKTWSQVSSLRQVTKYGASSSLEIMFGWLNLFQDIKSLYHRVEILQKQLDHFVKMNGRLQRKSMTMSTSTAAVPRPDIVSPTWGVHSVLPGTATCRLTVEYVYTLRGDIADLKRFLDARFFSLNNLVKAGWAAVPYSFIIDWFFNMDTYLTKFLGTFTVTEFPCDINIVRSYTTQITECTSQTWAALWNVTDGTPNVASPQLVQETKVRRFSRQAGIPTASIDEFCSANGLTLTQQALAGAMIIQRVL